MSWKKFYPIIYVVVIALFMPNAYAGRREKFKKYLDQLEEVSGSSIYLPARTVLIRYYTDKIYGVKEVGGSDLKESHKDFKKHKNELIKKWEKETGMRWPRYTLSTECDMDGTYIKKKPRQRYDAHHIIPQSYEGPNTWWNLLPLDVRAHNLIHGRRVNITQSYDGSNTLWNLLPSNVYPVNAEDGSYHELRPAYCCDPKLFPNSCVGYRGKH